MWRKFHSGHVARARTSRTRFRTPKAMAHTMIKIETNTPVQDSTNEQARIDLEDEDEEEIRKMKDAIRSNRENPVFYRIDLRGWAKAGPDADFEQFKKPVTGE